MSEPHKVSGPMSALDAYRKAQMQDAEIDALRARVESLEGALREAKSEALAVLAVSTRHDTPRWNAVSDCARRVLGAKEGTK